MIFDSLPEKYIFTLSKKNEYIIRKKGGEIISKLSHNKPQTKVVANKVLGNDIKWTITKKDVDSFINFITV